MPQSVQIPLSPNLLLRPWQRGDESALVKYANNRKVWINLRDSFPHPYTIRDAREWVGLPSPAFSPDPASHRHQR
jgi:hypothetical protein